jgi:uncharacterized protein with HEPN domain
MTTEEVYAVVVEIDEQLASLTKEDFGNKKFVPLVELRNKLILKYRPCPELNWEIKNKKVLSMLKKVNWHVQWK